MAHVIYYICCTQFFRDVFSCVFILISCFALEWNSLFERVIKRKCASATTLSTIHTSLRGGAGANKLSLAAIGKAMTWARLQLVDTYRSTCWYLQTTLWNHRKALALGVCLYHVSRHPDPAVPEACTAAWWGVQWRICRTYAVKTFFSGLNGSSLCWYNQAHVPLEPPANVLFRVQLSMVR